MLIKNLAMTGAAGRGGSAWDGWDGTNNGSQSVVSSTNNINYFDVCVMRPAVAVVAYYDPTAYDGIAKVLSVSGTTITVNSAFIFSYGSGIGDALSGIRLSRLSDTTAILMYETGAGNTVARVLTVSGANISYGTAATVEASVNFTDVVALSASVAVAVVAYSAYVLTIQGTSVSVGAAHDFEAGNPRGNCVCKLDETHALVVYYLYTGSYAAYARVLTVSGTTVSSGSACNYLEVTFGSDLSVIALSDSKVIAEAKVSTSNSNVTVLTISGTTVTEGGEETFETNNLRGPNKIAKLASNRAMIVYGDITSDIGEAKIFNIADTSVSGQTSVEVDGDIIIGSCVEELSDEASAIAVFVENGSNDLVAMILAV